MPRSHIGVSTSLDHPQIDLIAHCARVVVFDETKRQRWSFARVLAPPSKAVLSHREDGIAVIAANGATDAAVLLSLEMLPDPVVVLATTKKPGKALTKALKARGALVVVCDEVHKVLAINEPETQTAVHVGGLIPKSATQAAKPAIAVELPLPPEVEG